MKKSLNVLAVSAALISTCIMTSCGKSEAQLQKENNKAVIEEAQKLSRDELFKKAAEEIGSGELKFIGTSSRFKKAIDSFKEELAKYNSACANMSITQDSMVDGEIYGKLLGEIDAEMSDGYDAALVQDGYQLQMKGIATGHFLNYIPKEWSEDSETNKTLNAEPFSLQYNMKTWMVNNGKGAEDVVVDNVWDMTLDKYKGHIHTMDPRNENVNMDWVIMLTQDSWCDVLKEAYEDKSNDNKNIDFTKYASYGEKKQYAYAFMDKYLTNSVFYKDDGAARDAFMKDKGSLGWIVYSKIASIQETAEISKKDITIAALGKDNADGNNPTSHIKGFGGFMYKHYLQIMPYTTKPWTSCAFINYLSTTAKGYKAWATDIGDYPSMPSINVDRTKYGHGTLAEDYTWTQDSTKDNVFSCLNDPKSSWWESTTGGNVVIETPSYIVGEYNNVKTFIDKVIAAK